MRFVLSNSKLMCRARGLLYSYGFSFKAEGWGVLTRFEVFAIFFLLMKRAARYIDSTTTKKMTQKHTRTNMTGDRLKSFLSEDLTSGRT